MINYTEAKYRTRSTRNRSFGLDIKPANPYMTDYDTDYDLKKKAEKKAIHDEIKSRFSTV